jgi:hypothetical protein
MAIWNHAPATHMDACISPDGQTLYISRAVIFPNAPAPAKSDLIVGRLKAGAFVIDPDSAAIMKNINTGALEICARHFRRRPRAVFHPREPVRCAHHGGDKDFRGCPLRRAAGATSPNGFCGSSHYFARREGDVLPQESR